MSKKNIKEASAGYKSEEPKSPGFILSKTSLDAQVKSFLQRYEEEASILAENFHKAKFKDQSLFESLSYLFEQEDPQKEQEEESSDDILDSIVSDTEETGDGAEEVSNDIGSEMSLANNTPDVNVKIDIEGFGQNVLGLVQSAPNKLDFENAIINMAIKYLKEQHDPETAKKLVDFLEESGYSFVVQDSADPQTVSTV